ncbi:MAG: efflux RND transporter permease subunit [bacterium]|nr:efflux RND transporter permease subunit [bacterium]
MSSHPSRARSPRRLVEDAIAAIGLWSWHHPFVAVGLTLVGVGALAASLPQLVFESDVDRYLPPDDPIRVDYDALRDQFGRDDLLYLAITPPEIFDPGFLARLREIHERLEDELPFVEEVQSLVNARQTRGEGDTLLVDELLEEWPGSAEEIAAIAARARANPFYRNLYLSEDGLTTGIVIEPMTFQPVEDDDLSGFEDDAPETEATEEDDPLYLTGFQTAELVNASHAFVASLDLGDDTEVHLMGSPITNQEIQEQTARDMVVFSALSIAVIALLLGVVFRRVLAILMPLSLVVLAVVATVGALAVVGRPLTFVSQIIPSFILAVGVGFSVHVLAIYFQAIDHRQARLDAIEYALRHSGPAIVMSSLTTAGGMASFMSSGLAPIRDIGIFVPLGVLIAAFLSIGLVPACLAIAPLRLRARHEEGELPPIERALIACGLFGTRHRIAVPVVALVALVVAGAGITRISQSYNPLEWLPEDNRARVASEYLNIHLGGSAGMELVYDGGEENALHDPEVLARLDAMQRYVETHPGENFAFRKTVSVADIAKEIHQALHGGEADEYRIADDRLLVAQELLLFENSGSDDLEDVVDSSFRLARISLRGEHTEATNYLRYLREHSPNLREIGGDADLTITGFYAIASHVAQLTVDTSIRSYIIAFLTITPLMMLFIGSLRTGIVSMAPNLMPIAMVMGIMGWSGAPLDIFTVLIGGIALGLVVDDTIHILHGFRRNFEETGSIEQATAETMRTTGRALLFTTVVLTCAFSIYGFASAGTVVNFGLLSALAVFLAFVFDIFLSPALLALVYQGRERDEA